MERPRKERVVPRLCFDGSSLLRDSAVNNDIDLSELIFMRAHNGSNMVNHRQYTNCSFNLLYNYIDDNRIK